MTTERTVAPASKVSDEILMKRYAHGDAKAFEELFHRYEPIAYAFFLGPTRSVDRAQDLYQELFLRIHRARNSYEPSRPFRPWFFQIARRLLLDDALRAFRSHEYSIEERDVECDIPGSEEQTANREQVKQLLRGLSAEERYIVVAAKVEGVTYPELAERLHKSVASLKQTVSRALRRLRDHALLSPQQPAYVDPSPDAGRS